jgi:hypothetical protein
LVCHRASPEETGHWQQYSVSPLLPGTPALQMSDVSIWKGELVPVHENPTDGY